MNRRSLIQALPAAALLGSGLLPRPSLANGQGVAANEVHIGALGPLTGATAFIGGPGRDGLQVAFDAINAAGGINGRSIRTTYEHAFTPAESVAAAKKLVEQDRVFALVLASGSTGAAAAADYVRETGVPTYNIFGATSVIRQPFARNVFHSAIPDADTSGLALINRARAVAPGVTRLGILAGSYAFPQANLRAIEPRLREMGIEPVVQQFEQNARDFTGQLIALARARVPVVIVLGSFSEAGFAIRQAPEKGLPGAQWVVDGSAVNDGIVPLLGGVNLAAISGYSNVPYFASQPHPVPQRFRQLWTARHGQPPQGRPNLYDLVGYGSAHVLALAIQAAGANPTWEGLIAAWSSLKDARPSRLGGVDTIYPESFGEGDHQGNKTLGVAVIRDGIWQVMS
jgi:branched-chain amino acid transport system substrate-binding protein